MEKEHRPVYPARACQGQALLFLHETTHPHVGSHWVDPKTAAADLIGFAWTCVQALERLVKRLEDPWYLMVSLKDVSHRIFKLLG